MLTSPMSFAGVTIVSGGEFDPNSVTVLSASPTLTPLLHAVASAGAIR